MVSNGLSVGGLKGRYNIGKLRNISESFNT